MFLLFFSNIHYIDFEGHEHYYTMQQYPAMLEKKVKLLNYFMNYMKEHLLKAGANMQLREGEEFNISFYFFLNFFDLIWFDLIWFDLIWFDLIWFF